MSKREWLQIDSWLNKNKIYIYVVPLSNREFVIEIKNKDKPIKVDKLTYTKSQKNTMYERIKALKQHYFSHYNKPNQKKTRSN